MIVLGALSLLLVVFFSMSEDIARNWPQTASLYNALGYNVNTKGFEIVATQSEEYANSLRIIVIKGELVNVTGRELPTPSVRIAVRDRHEKELHHWIVKPDQESVGPRGKGSFSARLESPPADAVDIQFRLAKEGER